MTDTSAIKVFCSHRSVDKPEVEAFARLLREQHGIDAWFDQWEIAPGDNLVAKINEGLAQCEVGLAFFSSKTWDGRWFDAEVSTLTLFQVEHGRRLIPVMLDADASKSLPPLLLTLARRSADQLDLIADAILGRQSKPALGAAPLEKTVTRLTLKLDRSAKPDRIDITAVRDGQDIAQAHDVKLNAALQGSFTQFVHGQYKTAQTQALVAASYDATKDSSPAPSRYTPLGKQFAADLQQLGDQLGHVLLAGDIGPVVSKALAEVSGQHRLDLAFEADDTMLLSLPFEALRLSGQSLALQAGVQMRRVVRTAPHHHLQAAPAPLKILVAVGAPDEGKTPNSVLDLERELQYILGAVEKEAKNQNAAVRFLEVSEPRQIQKALTRDHYHVLHLSGHGDAGSIELDDEDGRPVTVDAKALADALKSAKHPVPLIMLSSCSSGASNLGNEALALGLIRHGVPLVIAMQTRVSDHYASALAGAFYEALLECEQIEPAEALATARQGLEDKRRAAILKGQAPLTPQPEYATATLFCHPATTAQTLVVYSTHKIPLVTPPVHTMDGPVPKLEVGDLVGRRTELRRALKVLRDDPASLDQIGKRAGVVLTALGGAGKSSVAGRLMARLSEDGWIVAVVQGRFNFGGLCQAVAGANGCFISPQSAASHQLLGQANADDQHRLTALSRLLQTDRLLLVLDNFEDNLTEGGQTFADQTVAQMIEDLARAAGNGRGKLLVTCRYPLPGLDYLLAHQTLPPLSHAQSRKLMWRLQALRNLSGEETREVLRLIGGHPRLLEFLDGLLRQGNARLPEVIQQLGDHASQLGHNPKDGVDGLDDALRLAVQIGARDVLLDALLAIVREAGDAAVLLQCAVSNLPWTAQGLAQAMSEHVPEPKLVKDNTTRALRRLAALSLVTEVGERQFWVHRWTAQALKESGDSEAFQQACARAGRFRMLPDSRGGFQLANIVEATFNFLDAQDFDSASKIGLQIVEFFRRKHQSLTAANFAADVARRLPAASIAWAGFVQIEADCWLRLGQAGLAYSRSESIRDALESQLTIRPNQPDLERALSVTYNQLGGLMRALGRSDDARRYFEQALAIAQTLAQAEPERTDYQHDLSVAFEHLGDLMRALGRGDDARDYFEQALTIRYALAQAEPKRADYQHDLSVSFENLGDLMRTLGRGDDARDYFEQALTIRHALAQAEPKRADYQRALSISFNQLGDLMRTLGRGDDARDYFEQALTIRQALAQAEPERADYQHNLGASYDKLGDLMRSLGRDDDAHYYFEQALAIAQALVQAEPERADYQRDLSVSFSKLGDLMRALGRSDDARRYFEQDLKIAQALARAEPERADYQHDLSVAFERLGDLMRALGRGDDARHYFEQLLTIRHALAQAEPERADYQRDLSVSFELMALTIPEQAQTWLQQSFSIRLALAEANPNQAELVLGLARTSLHIGSLGGPSALSHAEFAELLLRQLATHDALMPADVWLVEAAAKMAQTLRDGEAPGSTNDPA